MDVAEACFWCASPKIVPPADSLNITSRIAPQPINKRVRWEDDQQVILDPIAKMSLGY